MVASTGHDVPDPSEPNSTLIKPKAYTPHDPTAMRAFNTTTTALITSKGLGEYVAPSPTIAHDAPFDVWRAQQHDARFHGALTTDLQVDAKTQYLKWRADARAASRKVYGILLSIPGVASDKRIANILDDDERFAVHQDGVALFRELMRPLQQSNESPMYSS